MTLAELRPSMTTTQRQRADALLDAIENLKIEVRRYQLELNNIELFEPALASPRSAADVRLFDRPSTGRRVSNYRRRIG